MFTIIRNKWFASCIKLIYLVVIPLAVTLLVSHLYYKKAADDLRKTMEGTIKTLENRVGNIVGNATIKSTEDIKSKTEFATTEAKKGISKTVENKTEELKEEIKKEIIESIYPKNLALLINGKEYSSTTSNWQIVNNGTETREINLYFAVKNNSNYPSKDIIVSIYLSKNTIEENVGIVEEHYKKVYGDMLAKESLTIGQDSYEGVGFVINIPILPGGTRYTSPLTLNMLGNQAFVFVVLNQNYFSINYELNNGKK